jgi:hypothetical protein
MAITDANRWEMPDPTALHRAAPLVFRMLSWEDDTPSVSLMDRFP